MLRIVLTLATLLSLLTLTTASAAISDLMIRVDEAKDLLGKPDVVFWFAGTEADFKKGHIPGSVFGFSHDMQYLDDVIACEGLPMCPDRAAKFIGAHGVGNTTQVIVYDDGKGVNESGLWFFLTLYGHQKVQMMEGGTGGWEAAGGSLEDGPPQQPAAQTFSPQVDRSMVATISEVAEGLEDDNTIVLDARHKFTEYTGQDLKVGMKNASEHITVARGGHIPGAVFSPWTKYAANKKGEAGKPFFKNEASLQKSIGRLKSKGYSSDTKVITYCHVGLGRGSFQYLAFKLAGHKDVKLYVGSWNEWGNSDRPIAVR